MGSILLPLCGRRCHAVADEGALPTPTPEPFRSRNARPRAHHCPDHGNGRTPHALRTNPNRARILRRNQTDVERRLWRLLRDRRLEGFKFRRQQSIGPYFADFACIDKRLVVEADGGQHSDRAGYDRARTHYLESCGYRVMGFWNHEVILAEEAVLEEILRMLRTQ